MKYYAYVFMMVLSLTLSFSVAGQQILRTSYYSQNIPPQLFLDAQGRPTSGILFDITHAIADKTNAKLEMLPIPRKRIEQSLIRNIVDMHCAANKKWYKRANLQWSEVLYNNPDILINNIGLTKITDLAEYKNIEVGTSLGYIYPELTPYISNKNIIPVTSLSPGDSYKKYRKNRIAGFVIPEIEASYLAKEPSDAVITLNENEIRCAFSPSMKRKQVKQINNIILDLKSSGQIDMILSKYNNRPKVLAQDRSIAVE